MVAMVLWADYYRSTVQGDCAEYVKKCAKCQEFDLLKMVAAPSRHVFDEDFYIQFMYISFCFKCVLGSV